MTERKVEGNSPESSKPTASEKSTSDSFNSQKPIYLRFLRVIANLSLVFAVLASVGFVCNGLKVMLGNDKGFFWLVALILAISGFILFGVLTAIAHITENMTDVGSYVRESRNQKKS